MKKLLSIDNVSVSYTTKKETIPVIVGLSLQVEQGEACVLLGPSGCGKSTLINALAGTIALSCGAVDYQKENDRRALRPNTHKIGIIPQNCGLLPWKTVQENCLLPLVIRREPITQERKREIERIYSTLGVLNLLHRYPAALSGGQTQRAALARAFIQQPDLLLMDEPFSSLDEITREDAMKLFLRIWKQTRPVTILVSHSIEEALYLGTTILVMAPHGGVVRYRMQNPFFESLHPQSVDYLTTAQNLRSQLKPVERQNAHE